MTQKEKVAQLVLYNKIMEYTFQQFTIQQLVELIDKDLIDLNPSYQRNFIWTLDDQKALIDTILKDYPLPSFFVFQKNANPFKYEMIDGQQRSKTIFRFVKGFISSSKQTGNLIFENSDTKKILNYKLTFVVVKNLSINDSLNDYYVLINKQGVHLNTPEINKSEYQDTLFYKLADEILSYQGFINLNLFTEATSRRMNDRAFVEELLAYLKLGNKDKKAAVEKIYPEDINIDEYTLLKDLFYSIIDIIEEFNIIKPIKDTRYKQKNDFYTLFSFVYENKHLPIDTLKYQYQILLVLDNVDSEGRQFIRPTNEDCIVLKEYANNCVTQSNSKVARDSRLNFFNHLLKNSINGSNEKLNDVLNYLEMVYGEDKIKLKQVGGFQLLDITLLNIN